MDWITAEIALGGFIDARNATANEVDAILCLIPNCCDANDPEIDVLCLPLIDGPGNDHRLVDAGLVFIRDIVSGGGRILVHCHAGRSRSVAMVARYLIGQHGLTSHQALQAISTKRDVCLSPGIEDMFTR
jgi:protein-tyrosine phosphatase